MVYYKQTDFTINISAQPRVRANLNAVVYSYDEHVNKFVFHLISENNLPIDLTGCKIKILLQYAKEDGTTGTYLDDINGKVENLELQYVSYELANEMRYYVGQVAMNIYIDLKTGEKIDVYDVIFTMRKSEIDDAVSEAPDFYVASFEEITKQVQDTANTEIKKIEAELPKTQASLDKVNSDIASLQKKVDEVAAKNPVKPFQAWANSEDGKTDFNRVKPSPNLLTGNGYFDVKERTLARDSFGLQVEKIVLTDSDWDKLISTTAYYDLTNAKYDMIGFLELSNEANTEFIQYTGTIIRGGAKGYATVTAKNNVRMSDGTLPKYVKYQLRTVERLTEDVKILAGKFKVEFGKNTPVVSNKKEDRYNAFMKYTGFSNKDSNDYRDYTWVRSDEAQAINYEAWASDKNGTNFSTVYPRENLIRGNFDGFGYWTFFKDSKLTNSSGSKVGKTLVINGVEEGWKQWRLTGAQGATELTNMTAGTYVLSFNSKAIDTSAVNAEVTVEFRLNKQDGAYNRIAYNKTTLTKTDGCLVTTIIIKAEDLVNVIDKSVILNYSGLGKVEFSLIKLEKSETQTMYTPSPKDSGVKVIDLAPAYRGISNTPSQDYLDYVWDKSEQYRDAELQQIRTAITAMGGTF